MKLMRPGRARSVVQIGLGGGRREVLNWENTGNIDCKSEHWR